MDLTPKQEDALALLLLQDFCESPKRGWQVTRQGDEYVVYVADAIGFVHTGVAGKFSDAVMAATRKARADILPCQFCQGDLNRESHRDWCPVIGR